MSDLSHVGVKGMRWGVRKSLAGGAATSKFLKDNFELSKEGKIAALEILAVSGAVVAIGLTKK